MLVDFKSTICCDFPLDYKSGGAADYVYSSAVDYAGEKGLLEDVVVLK